MPGTYQNGAETRDIEQTSSDQESGSLAPCVKRPSKQLFASPWNQMWSEDVLGSMTSQARCYRLRRPKAVSLNGSS